MKKWEYLYKIDYVDGTLNSTNLLYSPLINKERNVLCMDWGNTNYHKNQLSSELKHHFFKNEMKFLNHFKNFQWCPQILDVIGDKIYLEFHEETLNNVVMNNRDLDTECPSWRDQIGTMLQDINKNSCYKVTLYPHCFFIKTDVVKTIDFYGCIPFEERLYPLEKISELIGKDSVNRFAEAVVGDKIDFKIFFDRLKEHHLNKYWPKNPFLP